MSNSATSPSAVIDRLRNGVFDTVALGEALAEASAGGHLRLWSRVPAVEGPFERAGIAGGAGAIDPQQTFHVAVENRASNKLDYFLQVEVTQHIRTMNNGDTVIDTVVALQNSVPPGSPASAQIGPDLLGTTKHPGDYLGWVLLWAPVGAIQPPSIPEGGLTLSQTNVLVPAGERAEVRFETILRHAVTGGVVTLRYVPQARLVPETLSARGQRRGSSANEPRPRRGPPSAGSLGRARPRCAGGGG